MTEGPEKPSREQVAMMEVGATRISPRLARIMAISFIGLIAAVPAIQHAADLSRNPAAWPECYGIFGAVGRTCRDARRGGGLAENIMSANARLTRELRDYENALEDESQVNKFLRPVTQLAIFKAGAGNKQVYVGNDGWLFYKPDVDYVTGRGFLEPPARPAAGKMPEPRQADPVRAIADFNDQLARRRIRLLVVPTPNKAMVHPEMFAHCWSARGCPPAGEGLENPSHDEFIRRLNRAGVPVFDPSAALREYRLAAGGRQAFLKGDSHWTAPAASAVAGALAEFIGGWNILRQALPAGFHADNEPVAGTGDLTRMLCLPDWCAAGHENGQPIVKSVVRDDKGGIWQPDKNADILLLGDSFSNIYSSPALGWGQAGGLAELLSLHLDRPVDSVLVNDNGAWATRQALVDELAAGSDRLAGKRLVIWQFAARELAAGDWRMIDLAGPLMPATPASDFYVPPKGKEETVTAAVAAVGPIPRPRNEPYDHITWVHLKAVNGVETSQALVYIWSMRNNRPVDAAGLKIGQTVRLQLRRWDEAPARIKTINRSRPYYEPLKSAGPCWGEMEK
ncbi:MAG: hypothetical protein HZA50_06100 [Planctomycetes bacterium]|nr:hypothetical protein [Planctomycetota bacterium]